MDASRCFWNIFGPLAARPLVNRGQEGVYTGGFGAQMFPASAGGTSSLTGENWLPRVIDEMALFSALLKQYYIGKLE